ncbi:MAG TPA: glycerol kinase GlpK [Bacteroidales bacterium]|nr:glycerol kinase GlpK [Bacteroidales bacterium]HPS17940.1 glycerol kinase GlpK [Bacteroidales bacterium]
MNSTQKKYILSIDQGTTSCRAILFDKNAVAKSVSQKEIKQIFPEQGWVEHNPEEIYKTQIEVCKDVLVKTGLYPESIAAIGITNQRETTILWNKNTGKPVYNAIVWQDTRTNAFCHKMKNDGYADLVKDKTGLVIDSYFSAFKIKWILDNIKGVRKAAEKGEILFGTIDTWLLWKLTKGKSHFTDYSNASRTMLFNISTLCWDKELLKIFDIPESILPEVKPSSSFLGNTDKKIFNHVSIPVCGIAGDQQAALFGHGCREEGMIKNTYGTGCFMLMNTGERKIISANGLLTTIAWGIDNKIEYALEGSVFIAGAAVQWLRDNLKIISKASDSEKLAMKVKERKEVYFVPAFSGLGTPYWDMDACGALIGLKRDTGIPDIARAVLEAIAFQTKDVIVSMEEDSGIKIKSLKVDGGATANNFLMQFQSDILNIAVEKSEQSEQTALGVALMAGIQCGFWTKTEIMKLKKNKTSFKSRMTNKEREKLYKGWKKAVSRVMNWYE